MVARHLSKRKPRGAIALRFAAKTLGVDKGHLSRVLRGERISKRLSARYADLVAEVQRQNSTPSHGN